MQARMHHVLCRPTALYITAARACPSSLSLFAARSYSSQDKKVTIVPPFILILVDQSTPNWTAG